MSSPIIHTQNLTIGYYRKKKYFPVQKDLNLTVYPGELVCLIGPNGCGKSTLLRTLSGLQPCLSGEIFINDIPSRKQSLKDKSHLIALVLTDKVEINNLTVYDLVSLGRNPYTDWLGNLSKEDHNKVKQAIEQVHLAGYEDRYIMELSDGEKQRAMIAKALVQDTPVIFLDEPTAHLDLPNRVAIMTLLHMLAGETGKSVVLSTHELDLALQVSDKLWLMSTDGITVGMPEELILNNKLQTVFKNQFFNFDINTGSFVVNHQSNLKEIELISSQKGPYTLWTERALVRSGYRISAHSSIKVFIDEEKGNWLVKNHGSETEVDSLNELLLHVNK